MTQPDQSELESDIEMLLLRVYNGEYDRSASQTLADVKKRIVSLITANYTPINQPSTNTTPVSDGGGGSESTNQSELEQKLDEVLAVFANYDESCEPGHEDVVLSRIERAKQSIKQLVAKEMNKLIMQEGVK